MIGFRTQSWTKEEIDEIGQEPFTQILAAIRTRAVDGRVLGVGLTDGSFKVFWKEELQANGTFA